ncbi:MAG TPA: hypothetical protein V6D25_25340 [Leptolyngbyaceae cyanobacterium]
MQLSLIKNLVNVCSIATVTTLVAITNSAAKVQATVLTFDDISTFGNLVPNGYGGLNWYNMNFFQPPLEGYFPTGYDNGVVSQPNIAHSIRAVISSRPVDFGKVEVQTSGEFVNGGTFDFKSAYFTAAWNNGLNIAVSANSPEYGPYYKEITVDSTSPTKFDFNFIGIDYLSFSASGGTNAGYGGGGEIFVLDNFTYEINDVHSVPESTTTLGLLAVASCLLRYSRKYNKNQG